MGRFLAIWSSRDLGRMLQWLIISAMLLIVVALIAPQQVGNIVKQAANVTLFAYLGYRLDRSVFPEARPSDQTVCSNPITQAAAQIRRALLMAATIIGGSLGL